MTRRFLRAAAKHLRKKRSIAEARQAYDLQMTKIARMQKSQAMTRAIKELDKDVQHLIAAERQIVHHDVSAKHNELLLEKVNKLEKRLNDHLRRSSMRSERVQELESKIREKVGIKKKKS